MKFQDLPTTKKGDFAEKVLDLYLSSKGIISYSPEKGKPHPFDRLCASADKKSIFIAECKGKARRTYYPDTGINKSHYDDYLNIRVKYGIDVWIFFVDEFSKKIYGNLLSILDEPRVIIHNNKPIHYPFTQSTKYGTFIRYFPLVAMEDICDLTKEESKILTGLSRRNYEYEEVPF